MLYLVGSGLSYEELPFGAIEICKKCDEVLIESYTSIIDSRTINALKSHISQEKIANINRSGMEEQSKELINRAKSHDIAVLIGGDPLIATTHKILFIEACKQKVKIKILHASSIIPSIIGECGLDFYRFGQCCTIPRWSEHYKPTSFYETILANVQRNLHTILLLDIDPMTMDSMSPSQAAKILKEAELAHKKNIILDSTMLMLFHNMGREGAFKKFTKLSDLNLIFDLGSNILILPSKLTDIEREAMESIL